MSNDAIIDQAEMSLNTGDIAGAERALTQQWPDMTRAPSDAQHTMAVVRLAQGRGDEAEALIRAAVKAEPKSLRHNIRLGHILTALSKHSAAVEAYTTASRLDANWPGVFVALSQAFYGAERFGDAERAARQAIAGASSAGAYEALSNALRAQGKGQDALNAADEALRLDWQDPNAQHARAAAMMVLNRPQDALVVFDELIARGIDLPVLQMNRGAALEALGRKDEARVVYEEAARRWPDLPNLQERVAAARQRV